MDIQWHDPKTVLAAMGNNVGLWRWEFATDRVQWSRQLLDMLGLGDDDFIQTFDFFLSLLHPDDHALVEGPIQEHLSTGVPYQFRCRLRHKDGHYLTIRSQGSALFDDSGAPVELLGTVIDVSNEVRIHSRLQEAERSFQSMAENVPGALFRYVLKPDGSDAVEYMSQGCIDIWEVTADELRNDAAMLWDLVLDEDLPAMQASIAGSASDLSQWYHRWRIRTKSGLVKHLEGRGVPVRQPDGSILWDSLILDMTRNVQIREELISQQKMLGQAQKMESIGRIAGGIAHDFNNLLGIIMGNAELMTDAVHEPANREILDDIVAACDRGSKLTRQLLSFARRSPLNPGIVNVDHAIREISTLVARVIPPSITVDIVATAGLWKTEVDVSFLENAVVNLCINARDAMPDGGQLTIETSNVRITSEYAQAHDDDIAPGRYVLVAVTDTGVGIPKSELDKVIEPFYTTKAPDRGSGLGLAMVDGFVKQSNGALRIYSELGSGTTVKLYLPAVTLDAGQQDRATARRRSSTTGKAKGRILVVEDEPAILNVVALTLERVGYDVATASSGDEAMRAFGDSLAEFDVLLTDIVMPGRLQGPALATEVSRIAPETRIVFMSGYPNEAAVQGNGIRPADRFLMKPVMRQDLLRVIAEAVGTRGT